MKPIPSTDPKSVQTDDPSTGTPLDLSPRAPRDFAQLARRISSRTTDLFAVALVALLLLFFGVQATLWWRDDPARIADARSGASPLAVWDAPSDLALQFTTGEWSLHRKSVAGNADAVTSAAVDQMHLALDASPPELLPPMDAAEREWLGRLKDWPPHERNARGDIFVLGGPWPWVVATKAAGAERRMIGWALALPQATDHWMLHFAERAGDRPRRSETIADVPLPTTAARVLRISSATGGFVTFASRSPRNRCLADWDRRLSSAGWTRNADWLSADDHSRATYVRSQSEPSGRLHVLLSDAEDHGTTGAGDWTISPQQPGMP